MAHVGQCVVCGNRFETRNRTTTTCSTECRRTKQLRRVPKCRKQDRSNLRQHPSLIVSDWPNEEWRSIEDFDYQFVSNYGRVCSVDRIAPYEGSIRRHSDVLRRGQLLKPGTLSSGHKYVVFYGGHHRLVHRLVLMAFVGPCPDGCEGLHHDDNAANNWLSNLRWGTRSDNLHDAVRNGKKQIGEQIRHSKLTDDRVRYIRANPQLGLRILANAFGVHDNAIRQVREFITWKHVV